MIGNLLRVGVSSSAGRRAAEGVCVCIYVFLVIIRNKNKKIVKTDFPNNFFIFYLIIVYSEVIAI
jgi:hypothetical protein